MRGTYEPGSRTASRLAAVLVVVLVVGLAAGTGAAAQTLPPGGTFTDDDGNAHEGNIEAIAAEGITQGCGSTGTLYCPSDQVSRGQMASFIARALKLPATSVDYFSDDDSSAHEDNINRLREAGVTLGCDLSGTVFCPEESVSRAQMASFLARALELPDSATDWFSDDEGSSHESNINKIADAGVTLGCDPGLYCPSADVLRDQMASFLARALELDPLVPPARIVLEPDGLGATLPFGSDGTAAITRLTQSFRGPDSDTVDAFVPVTGVGFPPGLYGDDPEFPGVVYEYPFARRVCWEALCITASSSDGTTWVFEAYASSLPGPVLSTERGISAGSSFGDTWAAYPDLTVGWGEGQIVGVVFPGWEPVYLGVAATSTLNIGAGAIPGFDYGVIVPSQIPSDAYLTIITVGNVPDPTCC